MDRSGVPLVLSNDAVANFGTSGNLGVVLDTRANRLVIGSLTSGAVASAAGFQVGDQILAVNNAWVRSPAELRAALNSAVQNDGRAWVYVTRNGTPQWVSLDLAAASRSRLGVVIQDHSGVVTIANVHPGSAALAAGLRPGDEIISVNGVEVASTADLRAQLRAAAEADGEVVLDIRRDGADRTLRTRLGAASSLAAGTRGEAGRTTAGFRGAADATGGAGRFDRIEQLRTEIGDLRDMVRDLSKEEGELSRERLTEIQDALDALFRRLDALGERDTSRTRR